MWLKRKCEEVPQVAVQQLVFPVGYGKTQLLEPCIHSLSPVERAAAHPGAWKLRADGTPSTRIKIEEELLKNIH